MERLLEFAESIGAKVKYKPIVECFGLVDVSNGNIKIALSDKMTEEKAKYTLAHELAHLYLHEGKGNIIESPLYYEYEEQADRGAKMLLDFMAMQESSVSV